MKLNSENFERLLRDRFRDYQKIYDRLPIFCQNLLVTLRGLFLVRLRYHRLFWQTLEEILVHDRYSPDELQAYQNRQLQAVAKHAYTHIPFYRGLMQRSGVSPDDLKSAEGLSRMPVIQRTDVRSHFPEMQMRNGSGRIVVHTSGTSGAGIPVAYNKADLARNWAFMFRQFIWAGVQPGDWRLSLFGSKIASEEQSRLPFWRYNFFEKQILLSIYHLSDKNKTAYLAFLRSHTGMPLEGFASVLGIVADFVLQEGESIPMKMVYTTGEPMDDRLRQKVKRAFDCKVYDCYGMTEWAGLIQECEHGSKHLISDFGILEILDEEGHAVVPGEEGYLVWTSLQKQEMPFIRYRVGDRGVWSIRPHCTCGRPYPLVDATITRDGDVIETPVGELYSPRVINQFLKNKVSFNFCQLIQKSVDKVHIRVVPGNGEYRAEAEQLAADLKRLFKNTITLQIFYESTPIMRGQGKFPLIINEIGDSRSDNVPADRKPSLVVA